MKVRSSFALIFLVVIIYPVFGQFPTPTRTYEYEYSWNTTLQLQWTVDPEYLWVALISNTSGWVAFGTSVTGFMTLSDGYIGSVYPNGSVVVQDFYLADNQVVPWSNSSGNLNPIANCPSSICPDPAAGTNCTDNVRNITGFKSGLYTVLEYARPLIASDNCDREIPLIPSNFLIWAWGDGLVPYMNKHTVHWPESGFTPGFDPYWNWPQRTRIYYIAAEEVVWNYAPQNPGPQGDTWLVNSATRIGSTYHKIVYRQYSDSRFTTVVSQPDYNGLLGPIIQASVGDTIKVLFKNRLPAGYPSVNIHPHGFVAQVNSTGQVNESAVSPGSSANYVWYVDDSWGPGPNDGTSVFWPYYSNVNTTYDINSGLFGGIIITNQPVDLTAPYANDTNHEYVLAFAVFDENKSHLIQSNIATYAPQANTSDPDWILSNQKHSINGRLFDNLDSLTMNVGDVTRWHVVSLNNDEDVHSPFWEAHTLLRQGSRFDTIQSLPMTFSTVDMVADSPGVWDIYSIPDYNAGMIATYNVTGVGSASAGTIRTYYIAAEEVFWNYTPVANPLPVGATWLQQSANTIGAVYKKAVFVEYSDNTFTTRLNKSATWEHTGILGPVLRAEVDDIIQVTFKNNLVGISLSFLVHGLSYDASNSGSIVVSPGNQHTYSFQVPSRAGPGPQDASSVLWLYHSATNITSDINSGLIGPIIITKSGMSTSVSDLKPQDVDREFITFFSVFDENYSYYLSENIQSFTSGSVAQTPAFIESNQMHTINGLMFNNVQGLTMSQAETVRFYVAGIGSGDGAVHVGHWEGNSVNMNGFQKSAISLLDANVATVDLEPQYSGTWSLSSAIPSEVDAGMIASYVVQSGASPVLTGTNRTYYIAAEEVYWNYTPIANPLPVGATWLQQSANRIGSVYKKAIYRLYNDSQFTVPLGKPSTFQHTGLLGPVLRAEVGDTIIVVFKNNLPSGPALNFVIDGFSMITPSSAVAPGQNTTYIFPVTATSGPGAEDGSSVLRLYYSSVNSNSTLDIFTGLVGGAIVTKAGASYNASILRPADVDREFIVLFSIFDENRSYYLNWNIANFTTGTVNTADDAFIESNKMRSINGLMFDNIANLTMSLNENVRFYVAALGDIGDYHSPYWHGITGLQYGHRVDTVAVVPSVVTQVDFKPSYTGAWRLQCQVSDHASSGMVATFTTVSYTIVDTPAQVLTGTTTSTATDNLTTGTDNQKTGSGDHAGFPWWIWIIIGVGALAVVSFVIALAALLNHKRKKGNNTNQVIQYDDDHFY